MELVSVCKVMEDMIVLNFLMSHAIQLVRHVVELLKMIVFLVLIFTFFTIVNVYYNVLKELLVYFIKNLIKF